MGKRGPVPEGQKNAITVLQTAPRQPRPNPPHGMTTHARNLFKRIVAGHPEGTFDPEAVVLLRGFCDAEDIHNQASKVLAKEGPVVDMVVGWMKPQEPGGDKTPLMKPMKNPWFGVKKDSLGSMCTTSRHLKQRGVDTGKQKRPVATSGRKMFKG